MQNTIVEIFNIHNNFSSDKVMVFTVIYNLFLIILRDIRYMIIIDCRISTKRRVANRRHSLQRWFLRDGIARGHDLDEFITIYQRQLLPHNIDRIHQPLALSIIPLFSSRGVTACEY